VARLRQFGEQLHRPIDFSNQQEDTLANGTPNYALRDILTNPSGVLILGVGGFGIPPSPPNPSPCPSKGESFDEDSSSFEQSQTSNNSKTLTQIANQNNNARPWLDQDVVVIPGPQHPLPKHLEKWLPKFDPDSRKSTEDHIKFFMLVVRVINVEHENFMYRMFPCTFEGNSSTWYFT
jgi:hypothetical protein